MDIGLVYSSEDPRQIEARDFLLRFIKERGILARYEELEKPVKSPTLIVNGHTIKELRSKPRQDKPAMFPDKMDMVKILDQVSWGV
jgi:hypothetical protein